MKQKVIYGENLSIYQIRGDIHRLIKGGAEIVQVVKHGDSRYKDALHRADYLIIYKE